MTDHQSNIVYTLTDEAPALATRSLLPIVQSFTSVCGIDVETRDISLANRILAAFSDYLDDSQQVSDDLKELGQLTLQPGANIVKLPNISASVPQIKTVIKELQAGGYAIPSFPDKPQSDQEQEVRKRYDKIKGSAVNPVLREGNSDRRAPNAVKEYAKKNPHSMGAWNADSQTHVSTMEHGDFFHNEKSVTINEAGNLRIELAQSDGAVVVLKESVPVLDGEIIDGTFLSHKALTDFLQAQMQEAKEQGVLFSLHMKATMMKVSDPIIFGHAVRTFFKPVFDNHGEALAECGANVNNGFGNLLNAIKKLPAETAKQIEADIQSCYDNGPALAMVNSDQGITNLHVPSDVIVDASMPAMIRASGKMWNAEGQQQDTKATIPDSSYAPLYTATIEFCKAHGAFDPETMGTVPNVGLMAQKAEEYGSHDKTFKIAADGVVRVVDEQNTVLMEHQVEAGDIWRMCQVKDLPIQDWVKLAVKRARASGMPAVFWLDKDRAHDAELIKKVKRYLQDHNTEGLDLQIMGVAEATFHTLTRTKNGEDTIAVSGNVLRDYLTDLFPILELGTSAKMLSIVPLMNGGGLFETGAGGSAPKHVQQLVEENHLRWDSLGEFLALAESLEHYAEVTDNTQAKVLSDTLGIATGQVLLNLKSPSRKVGELDNRGSHFYLAMYWANALAAQNDDSVLAEKFSDLAKQLSKNEKAIVDELNAVQGRKVEIGGYYFPNEELISSEMRPSETFNAALASLG